MAVLPYRLLLEKIAAELGKARTGHFDHHFSTAFKQFAGFAFEMGLEVCHEAWRMNG
jgi:hypothetical protein